MVRMNGDEGSALTILLYWNSWICSCTRIYEYCSHPKTDNVTGIINTATDIIMQDHEFMTLDHQAHNFGS